MALLAEVTAQLGRAPSEAFEEAVREAAIQPSSAHEPLGRSIANALAKPTPRCRPGCPVLVVAGEDDPVVRPLSATAVANATQGARLALLPQVGHFPAAGGEDGVAEAIRGFLDELERRP